LNSAEPEPKSISLSDEGTIPPSVNVTCAEPAAETVAEITRGKAEEVSENLDAKIDVGVRSHARTSIKLLLRDIVMSLAPIAILVLLHQLW